MNGDPAAQVKFRAVSEAYSILGHDRERCVILFALTFNHANPCSAARRAYDRTLVETPAPKPGYDYTTFYETRRRRGPKATYAWEPRRSSPSTSNPHSSSSSQHSHSRTQSRPHPSHYHRPEPSPFFHPGEKHPRGSGERTEQDGVVGVSSFWRAVQVSGLIAVVIAIGGAFGK